MNPNAQEFNPGCRVQPGVPYPGQPGVPYLGQPWVPYPGQFPVQFPGQFPGQFQAQPWGQFPGQFPAQPWGQFPAQEAAANAVCHLAPARRDERFAGAVSRVDGLPHMNEQQAEVSCAPVLQAEVSCAPEPQAAAGGSSTPHSLPDLSSLVGHENDARSAKRFPGRKCPVLGDISFQCIVCARWAEIQGSSRERKGRMDLEGDLCTGCKKKAKKRLSKVVPGHKKSDFCRCEATYILTKIEVAVPHKDVRCGHMGKGGFWRNFLPNCPLVEDAHSSLRDSDDETLLWFLQHDPNKLLEKMREMAPKYPKLDNMENALASVVNQAQILERLTKVSEQANAMWDSLDETNRHRVADAIAEASAVGGGGDGNGPVSECSVELDVSNG